VTFISTDYPLQVTVPNPARRCRHCGEALAKATRNPRERFCCDKCETLFYRVHCRVCERPIVGAKNSRRQLCGRRRCKLEFRRHQERFFRSRYPSGGVSPKREERPTISKAFLPVFEGSTFTRVAGRELSESAFRAATLPLDPELVARHARDRKAVIAERDQRAPTVLIGPHDPPVNVVGGFKFPDAPEIYFKSVTAIPVSEKPVLTATADLAIPENLSIPGFLRRDGDVS
jgi:hypothetical protein